MAEIQAALLERRATAVVAGARQGQGPGAGLGETSATVDAARKAAVATLVNGESARAQCHDAACHATECANLAITISSAKVERRAAARQAQRPGIGESARAAQRQRARLHRGAAGVGVDAREGGAASAQLQHRAAAADRTGKGAGVAAVEGEDAAVRHITRERATGAAIAHLQRAAFDGGAARVAVVPAQRERAGAVLDQLAVGGGTADRGKPRGIATVRDLAAELARPDTQSARPKADRARAMQRADGFGEDVQAQCGVHHQAFEQHGRRSAEFTRCREHPGTVDCDPRGIGDLFGI
ncbi:hypothetical protein D3C71_1037530 [compost metagenome]